MNKNVVDAFSSESDKEIPEEHELAPVTSTGEPVFEEPKSSIIDDSVPQLMTPTRKSEDLRRPIESMEESKEGLATAQQS